MHDYRGGGCVFFAGMAGGIVLWSIQFTSLRGNPVDALIRACLLEERGGDASFTFRADAAVTYTLKWTLDNEFGLVFVAVYQQILQLFYVDDLLGEVGGVGERRRGERREEKSCILCAPVWSGEKSLPSSVQAPQVQLWSSL